MCVTTAWTLAKVGKLHWLGECLSVTHWNTFCLPKSPILCVLRVGAATARLPISPPSQPFACHASQLLPPEYGRARRLSPMDKVGLHDSPGV
eukprot:3808824-Amphidinium_carterae.1